MGAGTQKPEKIKKGDLRVRLAIDEWDGQSWRQHSSDPLSMGPPEDMKAYAEAINCVSLNGRGEYIVVGTIRKPDTKGD